MIKVFFKKEQPLAIFEFDYTGAKILLLFMALPKKICFFAIHSMGKQVCPDCCAAQLFSFREGTEPCGLGFFP